MILISACTTWFILWWLLFGVRYCMKISNVDLMNKLNSISDTKPWSKVNLVIWAYSVVNWSNLAWPLPNCAISLKTWRVQIKRSISAAIFSWRGELFVNSKVSETWNKPNLFFSIKKASSRIGANRQRPNVIRIPISKRKRINTLNHAYYRPCWRSRPWSMICAIVKMIASRSRSVPFVQTQQSH